MVRACSSSTCPAGVGRTPRAWRSSSGVRASDSSSAMRLLTADATMPPCSAARAMLPCSQISTNRSSEARSIWRRKLREEVKSDKGMRREPSRLGTA
ncbi:hypothetical protein D3C78_1582630 [compost metagenome]